MDLRLHPCSVDPAEDHEKCGPNRPTAESSCNNALRRLERRYEDLTQKYGAAAELLGRQRERSAQLEAQVESFERARLEERVTTIERVRRSDQQEQLRGLTSELEALFPIPVLAAHVQQVVARSRLAEDPYPHSVLEDVLPHAFHTMLYESRPPERSWRGGREGRENWTIGEDLGPLRTEATWSYMNDVIVPRILVPSLTALFTDYLSASLGGTPDDAGGRETRRASFERSGGRLMLHGQATASSRIWIRAARSSPPCCTSGRLRTATSMERSCSG